MVKDILKILTGLTVFALLLHLKNSCPHAILLQCETQTTYP